ncbi:hypothetical protein ACOMHN_066471 [Nucella lapillus]
MKAEMPRVLETILRCYSGDCTDCPEWSAGTCAGEGSDNWFTRSHSLAEFRITALYPTEYDLRKTENIVQRHRRDSGLRRLRVCRQLHGDCGGDQVDEGDAWSKCPLQQDHTYQSAKR